LQTNLAGGAPTAYVELTGYLRTSGSTLRPSEAIGRAVQHWIAAQREAAEPVRGYQWKCLFLPAAARTMSDALETTLTLVEHVHHKASLRSEQRIAKRRRVEDMALDD
jgi:hypothetical protein